MARNRVIYQSEALFVGPVAGGENDEHHQITRVQDISHDMTLNRTDIFEFGRLAALDRVVLDTPTVTLDFSYLLTNGHNEDAMGMLVVGRGSNSITENVAGGLFEGNSGGGAGTCGQFLSGLSNNVDADAEKNFYVVTTEEEKDADDDTASTTWDGSTFNARSIVGFGNGVISNYSVNAAVGDFASASVSVDAYNVAFISGQPNGKTDSWVSGAQVPSVDKTKTACLTSASFDLPVATSGKNRIFAIRPGDIEVQFFTGANELSTTAENGKLQGIGGAILPTEDPDTTTEGADTGEPMHIQNFSIDAPLARTPLQRIGSSFPYFRPIDYPQDCTFNVSALLADVTTGSMTELICGEGGYDIVVKLRVPCADCDGIGEDDNVMAYKLKNARLASQNFGATIGDAKTVDLSFVGTYDSKLGTDNGLYISGTADFAS